LSVSNQRRVLATIAAHERWARCADRTAATAPGRKAYEDRFIEAARLLHPSQPETELLKRAANLRSAEAARMAYARWHPKADGDAS
jgi:hypothetical protein